LKLAIIGAGIAGLTCAHIARNAGHKVTVFDKGRGPGGRLSTRRIQSSLGELRFDHGAQGFIPESVEFMSEVETWLAAGFVAPWTPDMKHWRRGHFSDTPGLTRFVGIPGMNGLVKGLAADLDVHFGHHISDLVKTRDGWTLRFEDAGEDFSCDAIVSAVPAEQAATLLKEAAPDLAAEAAVIRSRPVWSVMLGYDAPLNLPFEAATLEKHPLSWIARSATRPGRNTTECIVLQACHSWSEANIEEEPEKITGALVKAFAEALHKELTAPLVSAAHRWRYAQVYQPTGTPCSWSHDDQIGTCGDWHLGPGIEHAWKSGLSLGKSL
jgi:predicted NAD/FAD-dependent oxidoreductase